MNYQMQISYAINFLACVIFFPLFNNMLISRILVSDRNAAKDILGLSGPREELPGLLSKRYTKIDMMNGMICFLIVVISLPSYTDLVSIFTMALMLVCLIMIAISDLTYKLIPDEMVVLALGAALIFAIKHSPDLSMNILGLIAGYGFPALIRILFMLLRKKEGLGLGDCKLLAVIGVWVGMQNIFTVIFISASLAICTFPFARTRLENKELPFGPFIVIAAVLFHSYQLMFS